jgi:outer membrane lipoprotein LolB
VTLRPLALAMALSALAAGCATPPASEPGWTSGRLSLQVDATPQRRQQRLSVAFELRGSGDSGELRLNSPLGTQIAQARWAPGLASLRTGDGEQRFDGLEALSREALGEPLPLAALPDWLAGRPWAAAPHSLQPDGFDQLGWHVQTARLAEGWVSAQRVALPAVQLRVRLERPGT